MRTWLLVFLVVMFVPFGGAWVIPWFIARLLIINKGAKMSIGKKEIFVTTSRGKRAFFKVFGPATVTPARVNVRRGKNDLGETVAMVGAEGSEERVRVKYPSLLAELYETVTKSNLTTAETESLLNTMARDLLPGHYFNKVHRIGA